MTDLPIDWSMLQLSELVESIANGFTHQNKPESGGIPISRIQTISKGEIDFELVGYAGLSLKNVQKYLLQPGDILFSHINSKEHVGKVAIYKEGMPDLVHGMNLLRIVANTKVLPEYIFWAFRSDFVKSQIWDNTRHAVNQASINIRNLMTVKIPVPPLEEQKRIVETLDAHIERLDNSFTELEQSFARLQLLKESYRHRIVSGHYSSEVDEWLSTNLGKIAKWSSGGTPQSGNPAFYGGDIPWCVIGDLTEGEVVDTAKQITQAGLAASSAKIVEPGTVMLAMYGASIGRTGIAAIPMATNQAIACAVPNNEINPWYLLLLLQSQKRMLVNSGKGGAQPNISQSIIKDWEISVPPIEEQNRLLTMSDNHQERMRLLEAQILEAQNLLALLRRSILNFAFTGQINKEN